MTIPFVGKVPEESWRLLSVLFSGDEGSEEAPERGFQYSFCLSAGEILEA